MIHGKYGTKEERIKFLVVGSRWVAREEGNAKLPFPYCHISRVDKILDVHFLEWRVLYLYEGGGPRPKNASVQSFLNQFRREDEVERQRPANRAAEQERIIVILHQRVLNLENEVRELCKELRYQIKYINGKEGE